MLKITINKKIVDKGKKNLHLEIKQEKYHVIIRINHEIKILHKIIFMQDNKETKK